MSRYVLCFATVMVALYHGTASSQDYPQKTIRLFTAQAGGGSDFAARLIAQGISGPFGQAVIVENRATALVPEIVSKAPPDGYTLMLAGGNFLTFPLLKKMSYDPITDFLPITLVSIVPNVLIVHPSLPVKSTKELIALAKAKPGTLNFHSSLYAHLFKQMAGINIALIPYKSTGPALIALLSGETQGMIANTPSILPNVKSGKLRALGVSSIKKSALFPDLPTIDAGGLRGYEAVSINIMFAPANTPTVIVNRLNREVVRAITAPDLKRKFFEAGFEVVGSTSDELAALTKSEMSKWAKVFKEGGIEAE